MEGGLRYLGTWKCTYLAAKSGAEPPHPPRRPLSFEGMYSDLLYQPWHCAKTPLRQAWLATDNVRREASISLEEFREKYERPNIPVVLKGKAKAWPAHKKWTRGYLQKAFAGKPVIVGDYEMSFDNYLEYAKSSADDMPLYLFDPNFAAKAPYLADDYQVPQCFREDLFAVLGAAKRPHYRWLIMGPARSGSSFHKDPNGTSAWNAVVSGSKKWILVPPDILPPGVHASEDGADVATPVSIVEWFLDFYEQLAEAGGRALECVVGAGDVLFVPRGWWHLALNLEETVAVTHNFVSTVNLPYVLCFLRSGNEALVSGLAQEERASLHDRFLEALRAQRPEVLACLEAEEACAAPRLASLFKGSDAAAGEPVFMFDFP